MGKKIDDSKKVGLAAGIMATAGGTIGFFVGGPIGAAIGAGVFGGLGAYVTGKEIKNGGSKE